MESREIQAYMPNMTFSSEQEEMLKQPLQVSQIKERKGAFGAMLKYIKGDTAIDTANRIFGFGQWGYKVVSRGREVVEDRKKGTFDVYTADIELYVAGAAFPFPGDGMGIVNDPYTVEMHEKARKEATTDALKRALRHYGDQFGLSLYNEDDYVDIGDGTLAKVKDVHPPKSEKQSGGRQIVDSQPPDPTVKASSQPLYAAALQAKQRAMKLKIITNDQGWLDMLTVLGIAEITTGKDIAAIGNKINETIKAREAQAS